MKRFIVFIALLWSVGSVRAQVTLKVTELPPNTPEKAQLFISGDFNDWQADSTALKPDGHGNYTTTLTEGKGTVEYKITRGSWNAVEGNATGGFRENRTLTFSGTPQTVEIPIESWEDISPPSPKPTAENVTVLDSAFYMPQLDKYRRIWLYLPPDYADSSKRYPVLYMQDGQNLFDTNTSYAGSWEVEKTLNRLFKEERDYGAIVVGIDNGEQDRIDEYTPWVNKAYGGGEGDPYISFIVETLKPYIDKHFRTQKEANHTALIGSSLGGLISLYGGIKYSDVFSKVGSLSPAYWINLEELKAYIDSSEVDLSSLRLYSIAGAKEAVKGYQESEQVSDDIEIINRSLKRKGLKNKNSRIQIDPDGQHNEAYWRSEFGKIYQWLFKDEEWD